VVGLARLSPGEQALAQSAKSLREQLIGTWTFVLAEVTAADGSTSLPFGDAPKGILIFTADGHCAQIHVASDLPKDCLLACSNEARYRLGRWESREPAMAKKLGKSEKLDLILSELSALRADIKSLLKQDAPLHQAGGKGRARPAPANKAAKRRGVSGKPAKAGTKPVLVETAESDAPGPSLASRIA
jgi:Lipocalin-like domain